MDHVEGAGGDRPLGPAAWARGDFCPIVLAALTHDAGLPDHALTARLVSRFAWDDRYAQACVDAYRAARARTPALLAG